MYQYILDTSLFHRHHLARQSVTTQEMASCDWLMSRHRADTFRNVTINSTSPNLDRFPGPVSGVSLQTQYCKHCVAMHCILCRVKYSFDTIINRMAALYF